MAGGNLPIGPLSSSGVVTVDAPAKDGSGIALTPYGLCGWSAVGAGSAIIYDGTSSSGQVLGYVAAGTVSFPEAAEINTGSVYVAVTGTLSLLLYLMH